MVALSVDDLSFSYREKPVFSGVSFTAEPGEILGLVGPNGSGKTTLIKCIDGILQPEGRIDIFGDPVSSLDRMEIAKKIAYVPQSLPAGLSSTVYETILMGRRPYLDWHVRSSDEAMVFETMKMLGVEDYAFRKINELSGGERQRVIIARAIVQDTPVILMDEPTSNLDIRHQMEVMETMNTLAKEKNVAVIVSLHDLNLAARYCNNMIILKSGRMYRSGPPVEILSEEVIDTVYGIKAIVNTEYERPYIIPLRPTERAAE